MSSSITPISNHGLRANSALELAGDLFDRMEINIRIEYVYDDNQKAILGDLVEKPEREFFRTSANRNAILYDENIAGRSLLEKYGEEIFYNPKYWEGNLPSEERIRREIKECSIPVYNFQVIDETEAAWAWFSNELFINHLVDNAGWWPFALFFKDGHSNSTMSEAEIFELRKGYRYFGELFGAEKYYFVNDQSKKFRGFGQGDELEMSWAEVCEFIDHHSKHIIYDIPEYFSNSRYRSAITRRKQIPFILVDDFRDMRSDK